MTPDLIRDTALLTVSQWQRETTQERGSRLLYLDQARRWEANDNTDQYEARLDAVRFTMGDSNARI